MDKQKLQLFQTVSVKDYLTAAKRAADYIRHYEIKAQNGKYWRIATAENHGKDAAESTFLNERSLYAGAAGIGYFLLQLYEVSGDACALADATAAGEYLLHTYTDALAKNPGVHAGVSGEGVFLWFLYEKTGEEAYRTQAIRIARDIYTSAKKDENGIHWDGFFDLMGDAGAVLYWLFLAEKTGDAVYVGYAKEALDSILKLAITYEDGSVYWKLFDPHIYFSSVPEGGIVPNFAHGTAGIVYLLTKYFEATKDKTYLDEARKGFRFLQQIAVYDGDSAIVPYIYLEKEKKPYDVFYLGYCHGPAGDGIAVRALYEATGDAEYLAFYRALSNALLKAGVPYRRSKGYWNDCLCCGSAGVLLHFLKAGELDERYLQYAKQTADKTVSDAYKDAEGYRWYNAWTRIRPWDVNAHLGLYVGAAGSASALLSAYAAEEGIPMTQLPEYVTKKER